MLAYIAVPPFPSCWHFYTMYIVVLYCLHPSLCLKLRVEGGTPDHIQLGESTRPPQAGALYHRSEPARLKPLELQTKSTEPALPASSSEEKQKQRVSAGQDAGRVGAGRAEGQVQGHESRV